MTAVVQIARPTIQPEFHRLALNKVSKADALHPLPLTSQGWAT